MKQFWNVESKYYASTAIEFNEMPKCYFSAARAADQKACLILEYIGGKDIDGETWNTGRSDRPLTKAEARGLVRAMAKFHASTWGRLPSSEFCDREI